MYQLLYCNHDHVSDQVHVEMQSGSNLKNYVSHFAHHRNLKFKVSNKVSNKVFQVVCAGWLLEGKANAYLVKLWLTGLKRCIHLGRSLFSYYDQNVFVNPPPPIEGSNRRTSIQTNSKGMDVWIETKSALGTARVFEQMHLELDSTAFWTSDSKSGQ